MRGFVDEGVPAYGPSPFLVCCGTGSFQGPRLYRPGTANLSRGRFPTLDSDLPIREYVSEPRFRLRLHSVLIYPGNVFTSVLTDR
jgi:hypothetical protein